MFSERRISRPQTKGSNGKGWVLEDGDIRGSCSSWRRHIDTDNQRDGPFQAVSGHLIHMFCTGLTLRNSLEICYK